MARRETNAAPSIGNRVAPLRFLAFLALLPLAYAGYRATGSAGGWLDSAAVAFDVAALAFLVALIPLLRTADAATMRAHAAANDANRVLILLLTVLLTATMLAAVAGEVGGARAGEPFAVAKLVGTLLLVWLFANSVFALHYAHMFYSRDGSSGGDRGGLDFPGTRTPDYRDFFYFAFTLAMTFQTSDVVIRSRPLRHIALLQSFGAFLFNIGLIGFTVNLLAS